MRICRCVCEYCAKYWIWKQTLRHLCLRNMWILGLKSHMNIFKNSSSWMATLYNLIMLIQSCHNSFTTGLLFCFEKAASNTARVYGSTLVQFMWYPHITTIQGSQTHRTSCLHFPESHSTIDWTMLLMGTGGWVWCDTSTGTSCLYL